MANVTEISDSLIEIVNTMEPDGNINSKMKHIIENELIRRLSKYEVTMRNLEKKYGMPLSEFKEKEVVKEKGYSYEAENDLWEWESSQDGIITVKKEMARLKRV